MRAFAPRRPDVAATLRLATPVVVVQLGMMLMGVVDTAFVGRVSEHDLAAVGLGNMWSWGSMVLGTGALLGVGPLLAQAHGAGDRSAFGRTLRRGLLLAVLLAVPALALQAAAAPVLLALGQPAEVARAAGDYVLRTLPGTLPFYVFAVLREALQSQHRVRPLVVVIVAANLLNVAVDWALVFGNAGFPALGANGAAWATALARSVMALGVALAGWPVLSDALVGWSREALRAGPLLRLTALGLPIGGQMLLEFGGFAGVMLLMGRIGPTELAAHQVTIFLAATTFMVPLGVSQAAGVLVGNAVGRGDPDGARRAAGAGLLLGAAFMCATAVLFVAAPGLLGRLLTDAPAVLALSAVLIPLAGFFQVFDGLQVVAGGILRGVADVRVPFAINLLAYWVVSLPLGGALAFGLGLGPRGLWWGLVAGLAVAAALLTARVASRLSGNVERARLD